MAGLLAALADHPFLSNRLVLKGGTALNLYHGDLPRISVDADLNYIGHTGLQEMESAREDVFDAVEALADELGYPTGVIRDEHALRTYRLDYTGANGNNDHIKLDLNFIERAPVLLPLDPLDPPPMLEVPGPAVPCLQLEELAGSKLATLMLRGACRDLFDVATLSTRDDIDWALANKIALFHGFMDHVGLENLEPSRIDTIGQADYDSDLRNLISKEASVTLEALKDAAQPHVNSFHELGDAEARCRDALLDGRWDPSLLFDGYDVNPELTDHPGMEWRLQNPNARLPT